ncbi:MAG: hypothetical protein GY714_18465 [Desulfobacterales bacterium]|nr:hypothetical protein [Desulfobacterales bacterium]
MKINGEDISSAEHQCTNHKAGHQMVAEELLGILNQKNSEGGNLAQ